LNPSGTPDGRRSSPISGISSPRGVIRIVEPFRIRQIEAKALRKLRHPSRSRKLRDYLVE
jgi:hypothetical protein